MRDFFTTNKNKEVLSRFRHVINNISAQSEFETKRNDIISLVTSSIADSPKEWDTTCQLSIDWIGDAFISRLSNSDENLDKEKLDNIFSNCFRFFLERYLSVKNEMAPEFNEAKKFAIGNIKSFSANARNQIEFATIDMPISIFKSIANSDAIASIKNLQSIYEEAERLKNELKTEISEKEEKVKLLKESLDQYENAFNFVGLHKGFDELTLEKNKEKVSILRWIKLLSFLIITPLIVELYFIWKHFDSISTIRDGLIASLFPMISLIAISIYYFRVLLFNYKSVKSQLLQLDLRKTLCRFIQSYADYSIDIKKKDPDSLGKFEDIIFSALVTNDGDLPSTYDGLDKLGKFLKLAK